MTKTKRSVRMPAGIRNKMMAAVSMLLVSSIMLVSSTYAWFTLSTAPEVTGITTSVGANGNLEIALLNTDTYADLTRITSAVGDSSASKAVTESNVTWGNLVDLSDSSYNLSGVSLMPATLNQDGDGINVSNFLKTPVYGADGRVDTTEANTVSAVYASGAFTYNSAAPTYGVRAIGVASNLTARQIAFNSAKSGFTSNANSASRAVANAVNQNATQFALIALSGEPATYTTAQLAAMDAMAQGAKTSLESIVKAYANAGLAAAASTDSETVTDEAVTTLQAGIAGVTSASALKSLLNTAGISTYDSALNSLADAQTSVDSAISALAGYNNTTAGSEVKTNVVVPLIGNGSTMAAYDAQGQVVTPISTETAGNISTLYLGGGAVGTIAEQTGNIILTNMMGITVYGGTKDATSGALAVVGTAVGNLPAPAGEATSTISDTYGYVIDFAFRTNAANSKLQLQTTAANRVYEDGGTATQGSGSNVTFTYTTGLSFAQAQTLLGAVKMVFLNPESGAVYATAGLTNIQDKTTYASADVKLTTQGEAEETGTIVDLNQNEVKKVSVLVYLDGNTVNNAAVINADSSGSLDLNLQFSSSEELVPMQNTALKQMQAVEAPSAEGAGT